MVLHEHGPFDVVVREHYTKGRNKRSTQTVFGAWAVIDLALGKYGYKADVEITPTTVKKDVTGKGSASKDEVEAGHFRQNTVIIIKRTIGKDVHLYAFKNMKIFKFSV